MPQKNCLRLSHLKERNIVVNQSNVTIGGVGNLIVPPTSPENSINVEVLEDKQITS